MALQSALDPRLQYGHGGQIQQPATQYESHMRGRSSSAVTLPTHQQQQQQQQHQQHQHQQHLPPAQHQQPQHQHHHPHHQLPQAAQSQLGSPEGIQPYYLPSSTGRDARHSVDSVDQHNDDDNEQSSEDDDPHESPESLRDDDQQHDGAKTSPAKSDAKRPRACDSCRGLKVRCIIDPSSGQPCKRCAKAGRACIVTPPTRKRQKKADSRVAELEKKIDALTATLKAQNAVAGGDYEHSSPPHYEANPRLLGATTIDTRVTDHSRNPASPISAVPRKKRRIDSDNNSRAQSPVPADKETVRREIYFNDNSEVIVSNYNEHKPKVFDHSDIEQRLDAWVDRETAEKLFDRYVRDFASQFPAVVFAPGTTAKQVRSQKPVLFLAIIASTSYGFTVSRDNQRHLAQEMREVFADSMWRNGEKSLELIQALQIATLWYRPPSNFEQHMFYQIVHMAAIMAIDIGMGRRAVYARRGAGPAMPSGRLLPNADTAEVRRTWLTCYSLCISITMVLRRPILLRWNDYMQDCIDYLETAPDAFPSDVLFCQHVRLARIAEDIAMNFNLDDTSSSASMADRRVVFGIKRFERDLNDRIKKDQPNPALKMVENVTNLYIHEIALHYTSNDTDFKPPYNNEPDKAPGQRIIGADHVDALSELTRSCKAILDSYLAYDFDSLYMLPIIFSVRTVYATVVLLKLYVAATTPGEMMNIIKKDELHVESYLTRLQKHFQDIMDRDSQIPHAKFLFVLQRLNERYMTILRDVEKRHNHTRQQHQQQQHQQPPLQLPPKVLRSDIAQPNQGLHLLSEVAMGGAPAPPHSNNNAATNAAAAAVAAAQGQQMQGIANPPPRQASAQTPGQTPVQTPGGQWYPPQEMAQIPPGMAIDPMAYGQYNGQFAGFDNFDFSLGGMGMNGDMYASMSLGDNIWDFSDPALTGQYQGWM